MTSYYKNKSELYLNAAEFLLKSQDGHFVAVPHTAYYSCLLLIEHKCYIVDQKNENDIRPEVNGTKPALHEGLINYMKSSLANSTRQNAYADMRNFVSKIADLKKMRVKADYKNENPSLNDSQKSYDLAKEILSIIKRN